jgi:hypothetical protein
VQLHAVAQLQAVSADEEERVVDPDAQPDHGRERGPDGRNRDDVAEQADDRETRYQAHHGRDDREAHRDERPEREREDDHRC